MVRKLIIVLFACLLLQPAGVVTAQSYAADRFDVTVDVQPDGSFLVTETVTFRFEGGPFAYAFRELELDQVDRVEILSASMDGVELPPGTEAGQVEIDARGDPYEITWHFPPTSDRARTFTLQYRVVGNISIADNQDVLYWQVIPADHEYDIEQAAIEIRFPPETRLAAEPRLEGMAADAQTEPGLVRWQLANIPADQAVSARVAFPSGTFIERPPEWQAAEIRRGSALRVALPFMGAIVVLAAGFTARWVVTQRRRAAERRPPSFATGELSTPPDELTPAQAGFLVNGLRTHMGDGAATLLWLAVKGAIRLVEERRRGLLAKTDYRIELIDPDAPLNPHEADTLELLFPGREQPDRAVFLSAVSTKLASRWPQISRRLQDEMDALGLFDPVEAGGKRRIEIAVAILLVAATLAVLLGMFFVLSSGAVLVFPGALLLALGAGLLILGIGAAVVSSSRVPTTAAGAVRRQRWMSFRDHLKAVARSEGWYDPELLNRYLPYAVAFDLGQSWTQKYRQQDLDAALPWLITATGEQGDVSSMIAAVAVLSSIGDGSASSGAGAGGGGGGASGAG